MRSFADLEAVIGLVPAQVVTRLSAIDFGRGSEALYRDQMPGLLTAVIRLETWDAILATRYGNLVIAKIVCLVLLGLLGGVARRRLAAGRIPVLRWAGVEVSVMAITIGIAAALSQSA